MQTLPVSEQLSKQSALKSPSPIPRTPTPCCLQVECPHAAAGQLAYPLCCSPYAHEIHPPWFLPDYTAR